MRQKSTFQVMIIMFCMAAAVASGAWPRNAAAITGDANDTVMAIGSSTIYKGNTASARTRAIEQGLEAVVDTVMVKHLPSDALTGHFQVLSQLIDGNTSTFVQGYKVLAESTTGKTYRVVIEATVSIAMLKQKLADAGLGLGQKPLPTVLTFVLEKNITDINQRYWWGGEQVLNQGLTEFQLTHVFEKMGYRMIDPAKPVPAMRNINLDFPPRIDMPTIMDLGGRYQAEVVIVGAAEARLAPNTMGGGKKTYQAAVSLRAIRLADGKEIATAAQQVVKTGTDDREGGEAALRDAAERAGRMLGAQLAAAWRATEGEATELAVVIEGTRDLANFVTFRRVIKNTPGVNNVQTQEMKPDQATLHVSYQGSVETLADNLMLNTFERFKIDIYEVTPQLMRIALIPQ